MLRMLESQGPTKQTATETIGTLSSRLSSATLLEDRRAAILGLRSFAKQYPASVASGSLRDLISCLTKDVEDVDTIKVVLETLLTLFSPDEESPEASEEISFWLADEFTQRQDNIKVLIDLLEAHDFYSRLYSLQLISAIFSARPERTQECVLGAALGTSRLVATLDDPRDAVRNAGLVLLGDLTESSTELQKLVAFEGAFDRAFHLIHLEGSLAQGGIVVQDCLNLMANLVRLNSSNQSLFRESGCVLKLADLLRLVQEPLSGSKQDDFFPSPQRDKNIWGVLALIRLFLIEGGLGTLINQNVFNRHGLLQRVLNLALEEASDPSLKSEALYTCADMIRGNPDLQAGFAQLQVSLPSEIPTAQTQANGSVHNNINKVYVIDALLNLVIASSTTASFDIRLASCDCIKAYFCNHVQIRSYFLHRAIEGHLTGQDETANVLSTLLLREGSENTSDPYRTWFAAVLLLHLIWDDSEAKGLLAKVSEGDAENGEEVVTCIQTLVATLISAMQRDDDERVIIAYFMLLCGWLFEDAPAVDDLLGEGSSLQFFIQTITTGANDMVVVKGLSAVLLGIIYEYSTKDSPISRRKLQALLLSNLGRERYLQALSLLRQHPLVRDFEAIPPGSGPTMQMNEIPPYAFFDSTFIVFLKDNFSRLSRAIDRDPGLEIQITAGEQGIDRDLVDSLRSQIEDKNKALQKAESDMLDLQQKLDSEQANRRKDQDTANAELQKLKQVSDSAQKNHESELAKRVTDHQTVLKSLESSSSKRIEELTAQIQVIKKSTSEEAERTKEYYERSLSQTRNTKTGLETRLANAQRSIDSLTKNLDLAKKVSETMKANAAKAEKSIASLKSTVEEKEKQIKEIRSSMTKLKSEKERQIKELETRLITQKEVAEDEKTKVSLLEKEVSELESSVQAAQEKAKKTEEAKSSVQTELDDLLMVFGDLEEKRMNDKKRLKELGEEVSDNEDDDEDGEDGDEDDVD